MLELILVGMLGAFGIVLVAHTIQESVRPFEVQSRQVLGPARTRRRVKDAPNEASAVDRDEVDELKAA